MALFQGTAVANRVRPIALSDTDRAELERLHRASSTPAGLSRRVRAVLLMAQGLSGVEIAERIGYTVVQISRLRRRFAEDGGAGLHERARRGGGFAPQPAGGWPPPRAPPGPRPPQWAVPQHRASPLARARPATAPRRDVQVHDGPRRRGQDLRCRGVVLESALERRGAERR